MKNLPAFPRFWFRRLAAKPRPATLPSAIEPLESRIAPATVVSPTEVTFLDKSGYLATVTISKPLFTAANVNKVFTFDTGAVNGDNTVQQQLELLNIMKLGPGASTIDITISAATGAVDVGYINAGGIDLGTVNIGGDLGRIHAGLAGKGHPAIASLTVNSLGADGISTQAPGGNLQTLISGPIPVITINGDLDQASIGVGGGSLGVIGSLTITGSINGGATAYSGSIRTQGGFDTVQIDGSINGSGGLSSGVIGTSGQIHSIAVDGSVIGGSGVFSGAILATGTIAYAQIDGSITGGGGTNSGQVGTANILQTIVVEGSVNGGGGTLSGVVLAGRAINSATITDSLIGGNGTNSGEIGSGGNIGVVTIGAYGLPSPVIAGVNPHFTGYQGIESGNGTNSGIIHAGGNIGSVTIGGYIDGSYTILEESGIRPAAHPLVNGNGSFYGNGDGAGVISAGGGITSVNVTESVDDGGIVSGGSIGTVTIVGSMTDGSGIHAHGGIGAVMVNASGVSNSLLRAGGHPQPGFTPSGTGVGIENSAVLADNGAIGQILAGGDGSSAIADSIIGAGGNIGLLQAVVINGGSGIFNTEVYAGSLGVLTASTDGYAAIDNSTFTITHGISSVAAYNTSGTSGYAIIYSTFQAGAAIGSITANSYTSGAAINSSGFDAGGNIGSISTIGGIDSSTFVAGINLGSAFNYSTTGTFTNTDAANIGFGGSTSSVSASIGNITVTEGDSANGLIDYSTFLAGVHGPGIDHKFGTKDDNVPAGSKIGTISAPDGLITDFFESGSIGATTAGPIASTTYIATDSAVSSPGIGAITVVADLPGNNDGIAGLKPAFTFTAAQGIYNSTFISNAGIGDIKVTLNGFRDALDNSGISTSTFAAGHAIGTITVTNNAYGETGSAYGINAATFTAGAGGYGGVGDINITLTDTGYDGNTAGIVNTTIDGSVCACMSANMGSIYVDNSDSSGTAAGIVDSAFRTHGSIGAITALLDNADASQPAIQGALFSAYGSIGDITTEGSILADEGGPTQFLAGYDVGTGLKLGGQDLSAHSLALHAGQSVGNVSVSGNFEGSDIIASINPGAGYVFGSALNTNVGAGGSIGTVVIGSSLQSDGSPFVSDGPRDHAIEAANFPGSDSGPYVTAFGYTGYVPVVLYVDGGAGDVRITNLTQATG
jgi:hypothetical protein